MNELNNILNKLNEERDNAIEVLKNQNEKKKRKELERDINKITSLIKSIMNY